MTKSTRQMAQDDALKHFSASRVAMVLTNPKMDDDPIIYVNKAFEQLTGYTANMAVGRNCRFLQGDGTEAKDVAIISEALKKSQEIGVTLKNYRANGESFQNALLISPIEDSDTGEVLYHVGLQVEVDEDDKTKRLEAFENTVDEIQHRVKNHLSMILGLIRLKSREMQSEGGAGLQDLSRRIESLQLLYEEMSAAQADSNEDKIQLGSYIGRVANAIAHLDGRPGVRMNVTVEPLMVETETAVRIGLIVSEVLTNAMQHAFTDQKSGLVELRVTRTDDGGMRALVTDDGVGLPEGIEWPNPDGMGGRIVMGLCQGLGATLNVSRGAVGTIVTLDVPMAD
ncbi:PAS domain-containing protein [Yoonia sp. 208BN28-4]|uniref:PAS domain-containing protein n=1 Tax=Yoonia sp. 208BN28-4 TaxID=3126505 RepID=UPI003097CB97